MSPRQKPLLSHPATAPALLFLLGFALRASLVLGESDFPLFRLPILDMEVHDQWARALAAGTDWTGGEPYFRAPLYPYFLALMYWLSHGSMLFARLVQAAIGGASCALVYLVAREALGDKRVAALAGVLQATLWTAIYFDVELLLVPLELSFNLAALLALLRAREGRRRHFALAGLFLGLSAITRPTILVFALLLAPLFWILRNTPLRQIAARLALLYLVLAAVVAPVTLRNWAVAGEAVLISTQGGVNLYIGNNPRSDGVTAIVPGTRADWWGGYHDAIHLAEREAGRSLRASEVDSHYRHKALSFWLDSPGRALALTGRKIFYLTNAYEPGNNFGGNYLREKLGLLRFDPISLYLVLPLAYLGLALSTRRARELAILHVFLASYAATVVAFFVSDKLRMPLVPVLCIFAAAALVWLWDRLHERRAKLLVQAAVVLTAATVYAWLPPIGGSEKRDIQARNGLGELYQRLGDVEAARREMEGAYALDPDNPDTLVRLGTLYLGSGRGEQAVELYRRALSSDPGNLPALDNLGIYYAQQGNHAEAQRWLERALAVHPGDADTLSYLAQSLAAEGRLDEARLRIEAALRAQPNHLAARALSGRLAVARGDLDGAEEAFGAVLAREPDDLPSLGGLAQIAHQRGRWRQAEGWYRRYLESAGQGDPNAARVRYLRACALAQLGELDAAVAELRRALASAPPAIRTEAARDPELAPLRGHPGFEALLPH